MEKTMNTLPVQTYVRQRVSTFTTNVAGQSSGSIALNLDKPSDVTVMLVVDYNGDNPQFFTVAFGRAVSLTDFDIVTAPTGTSYVKPNDLIKVHLPAGQNTLYWRTYDAAGQPLAFIATTINMVVVMIDQ